MFSPQTHILLVEDTSGFRVLVNRVLNSLGYTHITEAEDGKKAYEIMKKNLYRDPVGLVLADIHMPVMDGLALLQAVRTDNHFERLPFIMLTAESEKKSIIQAIELGVNDYIIKPTTEASLQKKLVAVWEQMNKHAS